MDNKALVTGRLRWILHLLEGCGKPYLHAYVASQAERLARILSGRPYVLCTFYFPSELACLYDAEFLYVDRTVGLAASAGLMPPPGQELGAVCSYQQAFFDLLVSGLLPPPALLLAMEYPCADALRMMQAVHHRWGIPFLRITSGKLQQDLEEAASLLDQRFGRRESMERVAERYNQANVCKRSIDRLRLEFPGIADSTDLLKLFTLENDWGSETAIDILRGLYEALAQRVRMWEPPEGRRLLWLGLVPLHDINLLDRLPETTGYRVVMEEMWMFDRPDCNPEDLLSGMAERLRRSLFYDPYERSRRLLRRAEALTVAAAVHFSQRRCSFLPPAVLELRQRFEQAGIPWIDASADVVRSEEFDLAPIRDGLCGCRGEKAAEAGR